MTYSWNEIEQDWLGGSAVATAKEDIVDAFARVERILGREGVERCRSRPSIRGTMPTLTVVDLGHQLCSLDGMINASKVITKLNAADDSAFAELRAIHLLTAGSIDALQVEAEPDVIVNGRTKRPDFRIRKPGDPWSYVEVTRPDIADAERELSKSKAPLFALLEIARPFALEIYLRRDPSTKEVQRIFNRARELCARDDQYTEEIEGLGFFSSQPQRRRTGLTNRGLGRTGRECDV